MFISYHPVARIGCEWCWIKMNHKSVQGKRNMRIQQYYCQVEVNGYNVVLNHWPFRSVRFALKFYNTNGENFCLKWSWHFEPPAMLLPGPGVPKRWRREKWVFGVLDYFANLVFVAHTVKKKHRCTIHTNHSDTTEQWKVVADVIHVKFSAVYSMFSDLSYETIVE